MSLLLSLWLACAPHPPLPPQEATMDDAAVSGVADPALRALLHDHWEGLLRSAPTFATRMGDHRFDELLEDLSPAAEEEALARRRALLQRARAMDRAALGAEDQLHLDLFIDALAQEQAAEICHGAWWNLNARSNPLASANDLLELQALDQAPARASFLARVQGLPEQARQWQDSLRLGISRGITPSAPTLRRTLTQLQDELALPPDAQTLAGALKEPGWNASQRVELEVALAAEREALAHFADFLEQELLPAARPEEQEGILFLPEGKACYQALILKESSLPLSAEEVHARGLAELDRIHGEMRAAGQRLWGTGDLAAIHARLREDPALRFEDAEQILAAARDHLERAQAALPGQLGRLPQADIVVKPIPDYLAPYTYIAYYNPTVPGLAPGEYRVNTWQPETRRRFELAALSFHEAVPGHHVQISLAQELGALPAFRRHLGWNALVEGWALYAERLALEDGLYRDDLERMGLYSFDAWRASRLVVDTGIHAMGWSRTQAIDFMLEVTPLARNNIENEVDRYINWPGQALSYKLGQMEILALRAEAEAALGPRFDRRAFHDLLLGAGAVSLPVLRRRVEDWVATQRAP